MSCKLSARTLRDVEAILPLERGITPAEAHRRLGCWALITVRHALAELVGAGRVTADGPNGYKTYRRVAAAGEPTFERESPGC